MCDDEQSRESQLGDARACTLANCLDFNADAAFYRFYTARQARAFGLDTIVREKKNCLKDAIVVGNSTGREWTGRQTAAQSNTNYSKFSMAVFEFYRDAVVKAQQQ